MAENIFQHNRKVYNTLGKQYLKDSKNFEPVERLRFRKSFQKGARILDAGCGGGRDAKFFVAGGMKVIGIDASDVFIRAARKAVPAGTFKQGDLMMIDFDAETFDGIWAQAVLLHLKRADVPKVLRKFYKILKPNGLLHIRVKKGKGEEYVKDQLSQGYKRFYTYFSKTELEQMVRHAGFKVVYSGTFPDQLKRMNLTWIAVWARKK